MATMKLLISLFFLIVVTGSPINDSPAIAKDLKTVLESDPSENDINTRNEPNKIPINTESVADTNAATEPEVVSDVTTMPELQEDSEIATTEISIKKGLNDMMEDLVTGVEKILKDAANEEFETNPSELTNTVEKTEETTTDDENLPEKPTYTPEKLEDSKGESELTAVPKQGDGFGLNNEQPDFISDLNKNNDDPKVHKVNLVKDTVNSDNKVVSIPNELTNPFLTPLDTLPEVPEVGSSPFGLEPLKYNYDQNNPKTTDYEYTDQFADDKNTDLVFEGNLDYMDDNIADDTDNKNPDDMNSKKPDYTNNISPDYTDNINPDYMNNASPGYTDNSNDKTYDTMDKIIPDFMNKENEFLDTNRDYDYNGYPKENYNVDQSPDFIEFPNTNSYTPDRHQDNLDQYDYSLDNMNEPTDSQNKYNSYSPTLSSFITRVFPSILNAFPVPMKPRKRTQTIIILHGGNIPPMSSKNPSFVLEEPQPMQSSNLGENDLLFEIGSYNSPNDATNYMQNTELQTDENVSANSNRDKLAQMVITPILQALLQSSYKPTNDFAFSNNQKPILSMNSETDLNDASILDKEMIEENNIPSFSNDDYTPLNKNPDDSITSVYAPNYPHVKYNRPSFDDSESTFFPKKSSQNLENNFNYERNDEQFYYPDFTNRHNPSNQQSWPNTPSEPSYNNDQFPSDSIPKVPTLNTVRQSAYTLLQEPSYIIDQQYPYNVQENQRYNSYQQPSYNMDQPSYNFRQEPSNSFYQGNWNDVAVSRPFRFFY